MASTTRLFLITSLASLLFSATQAFSDTSRPVIMLTGYWPPTNEMLRPWSPNRAQNPHGWIGSNWEHRGYDIRAYFPEFPDGKLDQGKGDFEVDWDPVRRDFAQYTQLLKPIAIISFGRGEGPWEMETNATDYWGNTPTLHSTLPVNAIANAVNRRGDLKAWVDTTGDAGDYLCGFLFSLGAQYHAEHSTPGDPALNLAQGFIHVGPGFPMWRYRRAVRDTLRALIKKLNQTRARH